VADHNRQKLLDRQRLTMYTTVVINNKKHVLHGLLPPMSVASQNYNLRHRKHSLELPCKTHHLVDSSFIQRTLYLDSY